MSDEPRQGESSLSLDKLDGPLDEGNEPEKVGPSHGSSTSASGNFQREHTSNRIGVGVQIVPPQDTFRSSTAAVHRKFASVKSGLNTDVAMDIEATMKGDGGPPSDSQTNFGDAAADEVTPISLDRLLTEPELRAPVFGLFAAMERPSYFEDFIVFCAANEKVWPFVHQCAGTLNHLLPIVQLAEWLHHPEESPDRAFFAQSLVSWPLHTIIFLSTFYVSAHKIGYERLYELLQAGQIMSKGKGLFAALAVARSPNIREFCIQAELMVRAAFWVGMAYQQHGELLSVPQTSKVPWSYAMLVNNVTASCLEVLIDHVNNDETDLSQSPGPFSEVMFSQVISPRCHVLSGHPLDLMRLGILLNAFGVSTGVKVHHELLDLSVPENSSYFNQQLGRILLHTWSQNGIYFNDSSHFFVGLLSPVDGRELHGCCNLATEIAATVTSHSQDLMCSLQHLRRKDVLLDFSLGSFPRVGDVLAWDYRTLRIIGMPTGDARYSTLPSPKRSNSLEVRKKTFRKSATLNEILRKMDWQGKPKRRIGRGNLTPLKTSMKDFQLLINVEERDDLSLSNTRHHPDASASALHEGNSGRENASFFGVPGVTMQRKQRGDTEAANNKRTNKFHAAEQYEVVPAPHSNVCRVYNVSPHINFMEHMHRAVLTSGAVQFADELSERTGLTFQPHLLLQCPTVFSLFEYWDTVEFIQEIRAQASLRPAEAQGSSATNDPLKRHMIESRKHNLLYAIQAMFAQRPNDSQRQEEYDETTMTRDTSGGFSAPGSPVLRGLPQ